MDNNETWYKMLETNICLLYNKRQNVCTGEGYEYCRIYAD